MTSGGHDSSAVRESLSILRVECLVSVAEMERLAPEWTALFDSVDDALPFASYEWALAWWSHLRRRGGVLNDTLQILVVRDARGEAVAIAPMMHTEVRVAGLRVIRILQPFGADPNITEVRGMLVAADREASAVEVLARYVAERAGESWVQWCGLRSASAAIDRLRAVRPVTLTRETPTFVLALPASWDEFRKTFPRNLRESLRKCYNSLARDSHDWTFRVVEDPAQVGPAVDRLIELHGVRAARTDTVRHLDCFDEPQARRFLHQVTADFARRRMIRVFQLVIGGQVVATRLAFVFGNRMYLYYSGYDLAWARYSVMTTVVAEALRDAIGHGIRLANLSTGADESKLRWRPAPVVYVDARRVGGGLYSRLLHRVLQSPVRTRLRKLIPRG